MALRQIGRKNWQEKTKQKENNLAKDDLRSTHEASPQSPATVPRRNPKEGVEKMHKAWKKAQTGWGSSLPI
ncbi:hypothetical protein QE152_g26602 [Popillia japonica]|uniref:Uncharacterized protein n=1 Tax=Popillia japonica TaxID=7064 RepID=A0AAW1JYW0_POPJA